ncbi:MAG TPA: SAM-dependent chlorinase/fluorinase [Vicinamibacterales bacterium]|nr:SAM-dependent chlorinase/fluorinase [Vicinamibacterales bacterium]
MARPVIALLTDFGSQDHYAGVMKGVILGICPDVTLVDISHDLPPHDIALAAHELAATSKYFPPGSIFLVVVDPGVGTARRGIAAEVGDRRFVAPDNGVLTAVFRETPPKRVVELTERRFARPTVSRTFEGRDRFAPAAAWIAKGTDLNAFGRAVTDYRMLDLPMPAIENGVLSGRVIRVDRFGNVITNIDRKSYEKMTGGQIPLQLTVRGQAIPRIVSTYADIAAGEIGALFGSTDHLECSAHASSAAAELGVSVGDLVELRRA